MKSLASLFLKSLLLPATTACLIQAGSLFAAAESTGDLAANFAQPPPSARPWVYWFWCNGNVTKEGITADLEAMKRVGIGGVLIMDIGVYMPPGPVPYNSPQWHEMIHFALSEAARLGLKVNLTNAPGWGGSGGPWNTPEHGEQLLVWTEARLTGPSHFDQGVDHPNVTLNFYRDVALLAYPTPEADLVKMNDFSPKFTTSISNPSADPQTLSTPDAKNKPAVTIPSPGPGWQPWVQVEFAKPFTARALTVALRGPTERQFFAELQASNDGVTFRKVDHFTGKLIGIDVSFPSVTARFFRLVFTESGPLMLDSFGVTSFELSPGARVDNLAGKTLVLRDEIQPLVNYGELPSGVAVDSSKLIDLSAKMTADGKLTWDVPAGNWTLLRIGYTPRGGIAWSHPAPNGGLGLEVDKFSREAVDAHFAGMLGKVISEAGSLAGSTLVTTHIDSWETGTQNWTAKFREEFKARRGYDLLRYLPAMIGAVVDSPEVTERFLWDFRETAAELLAENYAGRMQELAHDHGMKLSIEAYGNSPADNGSYGARADEPMCEFWRVSPGWRDGNDIRMPSIAHVYGKPIVGSEAFTSDRDEEWLGYPGNIKAEGDWAFCMGINRLVFHRYAMQPWLDVKPGMSMSSTGLHYERTQTWWNESGPWHRYLARCQYLLRQGLWSADICYMDAERAPNSVFLRLEGGFLPGHPAYNFDGAPVEAVMTRFSVRDGRLVLPDGMSYRVLVLPDEQTMTPALLRKIKQLVSDGATVIGPKPLKSPSLSGYPACDAGIKSMADEVWGDCDGKKVKKHAYGRGRVISGETPEEVLRGINVLPDFTYEDSHGGPSLLYCHRILDDSDVYFVANKMKRAVAGTAHFRVADRSPEFWWPESGKTEPVAAYTQANGVTTIPMQLDSSESVFVVFPAKSTHVDPVATVALDGRTILPPPRQASSDAIADTTARMESSEDGKLQLEAWKSGTYDIKTASGKDQSVTVRALPAPLKITGPWQATFPLANGDVSFDKLVSWSESDRDDVKYFSGTATYHKTIQIPAEMLGAGHRLYLDLGDVEIDADITLNGKDLGVLWKAPYRTEIAGAAKAGDNSLEIKVTNLWPNRLIGDAHFPPDAVRGIEGGAKSWPQWLLDGKPNPTGRQTFTTWELWKKDDPLLPSGLLGPVTLQTSAEVEVH